MDKPFDPNYYQQKGGGVKSNEIIFRRKRSNITVFPIFKEDYLMNARSFRIIALLVAASLISQLVRPQPHPPPPGDCRSCDRRPGDCCSATMAPATAAPATAAPAAAPSIARARLPRYYFSSLPVVRL